MTQIDIEDVAPTVDYLVRQLRARFPGLIIATHPTTRVMESLTEPGQFFLVDVDIRPATN